MFSSQHRPQSEVGSNVWVAGWPCLEGLTHSRILVTMLSNDLPTRSHLKCLQSIPSAAIVIRMLPGFELWGLDAAVKLCSEWLDIC